MTDNAAHFFSALHTTSNQRFIIYFTLAFWQAGVRKYIYVQRRSSWLRYSVWEGRKFVFWQISTDYYATMIPFSLLLDNFDGKSTWWHQKIPVFRYLKSGLTKLSGWFSTKSWQQVPSSPLVNFGNSWIMNLPGVHYEGQRWHTS